MREPQTSSWTKTTFRAITRRLVNGGTPPTQIEAFWKGDIPWITGADFSASGIGEFRRFVSQDAVTQTATNVIDQGELLLVTRTGVGKLAIAPCDIAISQDITGVYPDRDKVDVEFLFHRMRQGVEDLKKLNQGTSINGIVRKDLLSYSIELPPIPQQKRIAEILSTVDEAIEQTEALIAKTQRIKAGLMHDLFTRGVTPDGRLRPPREDAPHLYKESPLGWIPKKWDVFPLSDLAKKIADRDHVTPMYIDHGILMVSPVNLIDDDGIDFDSCKRISYRDHLVNRRKTDIEPGDLILHRIGAGLGAVRLVTEEMPEFSILHSMAQIRPISSMLSSEFLLWAFRHSSVRSQIELGIQSIGVPDLGLDKIGKLLFPICGLEEQLSVTSILRSNGKLIAIEQDRCLKLNRIKLGLMHNLLTGRVRVPENVGKPKEADG